MDFTLQKYSQLISKLIDKKYQFVTFEFYCQHKTELSDSSFVIMRHDVDLKAENSLAIARIEHSIGVPASYYFRVLEQSNNPVVIRAIVGLGHEIGYHYEDMAICKGDKEKAIAHFQKQLAYFRQFYLVKTICMHGAPMSKFDGRDLWKRYDYHDYGIIGEPYFDVDFSKIFYLTDTGRCWNGFNVSVRDKIPIYQDQWVEKGLVYHSTDDIINAIEVGKFPDQLMVTTHPQRWTDNKGEWLIEYGLQSLKNVVKNMAVKSSCRK